MTFHSCEPSPVPVENPMQNDLSAVLYSAADVELIKRLDPASDDTIQITRYALWILRRIYREGFAYAKAGVTLTELQPRGTATGHLFRRDPDVVTRTELNETMDRINTRWGCGTLRMACTGNEQDWKMRQRHLSNAWTTRWSEIPVAR